jgi:hypothetical protein
LLRNFLLALSFLATCTTCFADDALIDAFGDGNISNPSHLVADLETRQFVNRFPSSLYEIVVIYGEAHARDLTCYAIAGVSLTRKDSLGYVPHPRFSSFRTIEGGASWRIAQIRQCEESQVRAAVKDLMDMPVDTLAFNMRQ